MPSTRSLIYGSNAVDNTSEGPPASLAARARPARQHTARNRARNTPQTVGNITLPDINLDGLSSTEEDTDDASVTRAAVTSRDLSQQPRQPRLARQTVRRPIRATSPGDGRSLRTMAPTATSRGDINGTAHSRPRQRQTQQPSSSLSHAGSGRKHDAEETDFMNRQADGNFLLGLYSTDGSNPGTLGRSLGFGASAGVDGMPWVQQEQEEFVKAQQEEEEEGAHYSMLARKFFTAGYALDGHGSKHAHEELEETRIVMMARLREQTLRCLNETRWMYEPTERFQPGLP